MKKKTEMKRKKIMKLKTQHKFVIFWAIMLTLYAVTWSTFTWITWLFIAIATMASENYEEEDEMSKQNILRANTSTMWMLIISFAVLFLYSKSHAMALPSELYAVIICLAIVLRSTLFLIFDRTPKRSEEDE